MCASSATCNDIGPNAQDLPEFPETAPDPEVRNVEPPPAPNPWAIAKEQRKKRKTTAAEGEASKVRQFIKVKVSILKVSFSIPR